MSDLPTSITSVAGTQRFRRVGKYDFDQLLQDLRDLNKEVQDLRSGIVSGVIKGEPGAPGQRGVPGVQGDPGSPGSPGTDGNDGLSAYEIAVLSGGFIGDEADWLESLVGASAYDVAVANGFDGTEEEWLDSLQALPPDDDDWGFIPADYGLITQTVTYKEDYGSLASV